MKSIKNKCGIALEGGGARGAYHMGAIKALYEREYEITDIVGTSIGAINGAIVAQGDFEIAYKIWEEITYSTLFDINDSKARSVLNMDIDFELLKYISIKIKDVIKNKGIDTTKMKEILNEYIDENKLRNSNINFGLVTYCLSDIKPVELYIKDIPKGKLVEYILASSRLPGFKQETLNDKLYIDGGVYNNCPISMLKNCKHIFAIKTGSFFKMRDYDKLIKSGVKIDIIEPRKKLTHILDFD
ncbi:MAG: patatin-like phospholipase family protein, partial [Clostridia bacterium]